MGASGAAPSAEREPDSLEREDDSLFPCLLELFLSHMSPAKSSSSFLLRSSPPPSHSLTHDPSATLEGDRVRTSEGVWGGWRKWPRRRRRRCSSCVRSAVEFNAPLALINQSLTLVSINIYSVQSTPLCPPMSNIGAHAHTGVREDYISISNRATTTEGRGGLYSPAFYFKRSINYF